MENFCSHSIVNHTPCTCGVEMACYFKVEATVRVAFFHETQPYWELAKAIGTRSCSMCANTKLCGTVSWIKILVHLSTTKTAKILPPEKYPVYSITTHCICHSRGGRGHGHLLSSA